MQDRWGELIAGIPMPVVVIGADDRVTEANPPAQQLFGALAGRHHILSFRQPDVLDAIAAARAGQAGKARLVLPGETQDRVHQVTVTPVGDRVVLAFEDLSALAQMDQMRRDFVANVSHELKTPLTAMIGFIETLRGPARDDAAARDRFLDIMEREAGRMNRLIQDLLSLSRVQSEERRRPSIQIDLPLLLRGVLATMGPAAQAAGLVLESTGLDGVDATLPGDADQLVQVFQNLIENALKYGAAGARVRLTLHRIGYEPQLRGPAWAVDVEDFGDGIDQMHLPRLTERFYRVDTHRSRAQGGTGLGLAIVKHIINRHRGRLQIHSRKGEGSRFTVILPETLRRG